MRSKPIPPLKHDADGKPLCRWCLKPVPKGRRAWCSDVCVDEALMTSDPSYARKKVARRDNGVCAHCGTDTEKLRTALYRLRIISQNGFDGYDRIENKAKKRLQLNGTDYNLAVHGQYSFERTHGPVTPWVERARLIHRRLKSLAEARLLRMQTELIHQGYHSVGTRWTSPESLWQADHILPVEHGGGGCGLDNYQTLCQPCHKRKTKEQAQAKKIIRRMLLNPDLIPPPPCLRNEKENP